MQDRGPSKVSPLQLGLVEQPTRPRSEYTAGTRRAAIEAADQGHLQLAADLTRAAMTEDAYARGVLGTLTEGLWGLPMNFIGDPRMIEALTDTPRGLGQWAEMFPQPEAIRLMSWGINLGVGVGQMRHRWQEPGEQIVSVEEAADGTYQIARPMRPIGAHSTRVLRTWDAKWLRHQWWDDTWWLMTADGEIRITPNDGEWILYMPFGSQKPWEWGAWMALTLAFVLGRDALFDRSRHAEVLAPVRVGTVPAGTTERQRRLYLKQIKEMQRLHAFVLPPGLEYKIVESSGHINDIYAQIIAWAERSFCLIYTGNETTTKGSPGFSAGDVQERVQKSKLQSFSRSFAMCLRDGGLTEWSIANYASDDAPLARFDCDPPEDKLAKAKTVSEAGDSLGKMQAGLATTGLRITVASATAYAQSFGFAVEPLPVAAAPAPDAEPLVAQGDVAKALRADEIRQSAGFLPFGDPRGDMTLAALDAAASAPAGPPAATPAAPQPDTTVAPSDVGTVAESAPPTDEAASALAAKMTLHGVARCEHLSSNRCRLCGVERTRDFDPGPDGVPQWRVSWRPIGSTGPVAPAVTPPTVTLAAGYNPDQERADDGKFGAGGGPNTAHAKAAKKDLAKAAKHADRADARASSVETKANDATKAADEERANEERLEAEHTAKLDPDTGDHLDESVDADASNAAHERAVSESQDRSDRHDLRAESLHKVARDLRAAHADAVAAHADERDHAAMAELSPREYAAQTAQRAADANAAHEAAHEAAEKSRDAARSARDATQYGSASHAEREEALDRARVALDASAEADAKQERAGASSDYWTSRASEAADVIEKHSRGES